MTRHLPAEGEVTVRDRIGQPVTGTPSVLWSEASHKAVVSVGGTALATYNCTTPGDAFDRFFEDHPILDGGCSWPMDGSL